MQNENVGDYLAFFVQYEHYFKEGREAVDYLKGFLGSVSEPYVYEIVKCWTDFLCSIEYVITAGFLAVRDLRARLNHSFVVDRFCFCDYLQKIKTNDFGALNEERKRALKKYISKGVLEGNDSVCYKDFLLIRDVLSVNLYRKEKGVVEGHIREVLTSPKEYEDCIYQAVDTCNYKDIKVCMDLSEKVLHYIQDGESGYKKVVVGEECVAMIQYP